MRRILAGIVLTWLVSSPAYAQITRHAGQVQIQSTAADALDLAGGLEIGSGNVPLVGTDGRLNGPLSSTILDDLSVVNLTGFAGDVTGTGGATVVGNDSHSHGDSTIDGLNTSALTAGQLANARVAVGNVTQHEASINHDALLGFVTDEHIAHIGVTITAGSGLTGGGTIAATRTLNVGAGNCISVAADTVGVGAECIGSAEIEASAITNAELGANSVDLTSDALSTAYVGTGLSGGGAAAISVTNPLPSDMIAIFDATCGTGWSRVSAFDNLFLRGAVTYGGTGGSATHTHTGTTESETVAETVDQGAQDITVTGELHDHEFTTDAESSLPPFIDVVFCKKD